MILSSSTIQYLFYILIFYYYFDTAIVQVTSTTTRASTTAAASPLTTPIKSTKISNTVIISAANDAMASTDSSEEDHYTDENHVYDEEETSFVSSTISTDNDDKTSKLKTKLPFAAVVDTDLKNINSTKTSQQTKSSLPIILASIFGSLGIIVLIACITTYILIKQGYIKVFNQPRTQIKNGKLTRITDSSSTIADGSPSRR